MNSDMQVAWAAGLFEGEGSTGFRRVSTGRAPTTARLGMTDLDAVEAFRDAVGVGRIRTERRPRPHKDLYYWEVSSFEAIESVLMLLRPWLKSRRGVAADEALDYIAASRNRPPKLILGGSCDHGHKLTKDSLFEGTDKTPRRCRACARINRKRHKASLRAQA